MNSILTSISAGDSLTGTHFFSYATFGRDIAQFHQLIEFLTWLSIILWCLVIATTLLRAGAAVVHTLFQRRYNKQGTPGRSHGNS
jgi:hypothetical protein